MSSESIHDKLTRVRKPHVHITMATPKNELPASEIPFVLGVLGDFRGDSKENFKTLEDRDPVEVNRDNLGDFMAKTRPAADIRVKNRLGREGDPETEMHLDLVFSKMEAFEPAAIVEQVPALKALLAARNLLRQLGGVVDRGKGTERILEEILQSGDMLARLRQEVGEKPTEPTGK